MSEGKSIFILDAPRHTHVEMIVITGIVSDRKQFQNGFEGIKIKDITGAIFCIFESPSNLIVGQRVRITGQTGLNSRGILVINKIYNVEILGTLQTNLPDQLDSEMRYQASRMLMSRICRIASDVLKSQLFIEFESRVITNKKYEDSLEPLLVNYPGFGPPAILMTSPAAQVVDFLAITLSSRAFTISTSFTSSYRFPKGSSETRVIVAKSVNLEQEELEQLIIDISAKILNEFYKEKVTPNKLYGEWPDKFDTKDRENTSLNNELSLTCFTANIPVIGKNWDTRIKTILHLTDKKNNLLIEGYREILGSSIISSITVYPSQFLGIIERDTRRQLQNLTRPYNGTK